MPQSQGAKLCLKCQKTKTLGDFYFRKGKPRSPCKDCTKEKVFCYYYSNLEKQKEKHKIWWKRVGKHKDRSAYQREYHQKNKHRYAAVQSKRRASEISATPSWLTEEHFKEIEYKYSLARELSSITGEPYEVDHIVPLRGKNVCGLHAPWNLQVLPRDLNRIKGNRYAESRC